MDQHLEAMAHYAVGSGRIHLCAMLDCWSYCWQLVLRTSSAVKITLRFLVEHLRRQDQNDWC